jgi:hypothetical protein
MLWNDDSSGIGETYYWTGTNDDPSATIYPAAAALMKARTAMMGFGVSAVSFRISKLGAFRNYLNSNPADVQQMQPGTFTVQTNPSAAAIAAGVGKTQDGSADIAKSAILANFYNGIAAHGRKFLAGVPDVMIRTDPDGPWIIGVPSWNSLFQAWAQLLTSGTLKWAFKARTAPTIAPWLPVQVAAVQFDPTTNLWGVDCPTFIAPVTVGANLQLRQFKMTSRAYVPFNGTFQIGYTQASAIPGNTIYYLRGTQSVAGTQVAFLGKAQGVDFTLYPFTAIVPGGQTTHKRGNRSLGSAGRRKPVQRVSA